MSTKSEPKHIHKFKRLKYKSGNQIFFCALPDCNVKLNPSLALGKRTICWRCEEPFVMTEYSLRLAKPHCENCHRPKNANADKEKFHTENLTSPMSDTPLTHSAQSLAERLQQTVNMQLPTEIEDEI